MTGVTVTRGRLLLVAGLGGLTVLAAIWFYQPDRQLRRAWGGLLASVEARNTTRLGRLLANDYEDRWGYQRRSILEDARMAFFQFRRLELQAEQVQIDREDGRATITALLRIEADGPAPVADARAKVNALFTPFVFEWKREPGFLGAWKLVRFDHPDLDLAQFRRRWSQ